MNTMYRDGAKSMIADGSGTQFMKMMVYHDPEHINETQASKIFRMDDLNLMNAIEDSDPVTNPFYYAQDGESWYAEVAAKTCEESRKKKIEERRFKKKKSKSFKNSSFIMRKEQGRVRQLIKIMVFDLEGRDMEEIDTETDNASVNVQYLVTSDYDDIVDKTDHLVSKIVQKLSKSNV